MDQNQKIENEIWTFQSLGFPFKLLYEAAESESIWWILYTDILYKLYSIMCPNL
jgi:hypothetical protein